MPRLTIEDFYKSSVNEKELFKLIDVGTYPDLNDEEKEGFSGNKMGMSHLLRYKIKLIFFYESYV